VGARGAREHDVWVLTRSNNREVIEPLRRPPTFASSTSTCRRPRAAGSVAIAARGLYYLLWQLLAAREARRLHASNGSDVVHHLDVREPLPAGTRLRRAGAFVLGRSRADSASRARSTASSAFARRSQSSRFAPGAWRPG